MHTLTRELRELRHDFRAGASLSARAVHVTLPEMSSRVARALQVRFSRELMAPGSILRRGLACCALAAFSSWKLWAVASATRCARLGS